MLNCSESLTLQPGDYLFRQGDVPSGFYGLNRGRFKVSTLRADGKEAILAVIEAGNWFGQTSMAQRVPRMRDVVALESSSIFAVNAHTFETLMKNDSVRAAIADLQLKHMNWLYRMVEDVTLHSTRARISRRLLLLAYGDITMAAEMRRTISVSQETLAMMLGITRPTLALELKAMSAKGAIALSYGRINILSEELLLTFQEYI
ncbi:Crp/Fnr family transcriptional regulator [Paraburkholderia phytofirmans OLGA172]|uniref:Crp/Fnr family transcriptional regulator n=1 Tax=Paraburkholderia phytofirmans OLGA172 TaxID=1417228 RepID=A0A160FP82_9BURK|nr:Crp/Fnr family transcriptional regulator [Paraburkholderia phytofirmans OLGA172]